MGSFGNATLWGGFAAALLSLYHYVATTRNALHHRAAGRRWFVVSALAVAAASGVLMGALLGGRYDLYYVAAYSSRDLPLLYKLSAFWAGQEGSFLLWALMGAVVGLFLMRKAGTREGTLMALFSGVQAFLLLLLVIKSPFAPGDPTATEGQGLNPLLQNPWMVVHPPLVFLGYAASAVPFVFAVAALLHRDADGWVVRVLPWTLFAWVALGAGIFLGGYWAYCVLGWGGYWGWDPVENASLVPWLLSTALLHSLLAQQARGTMKRTTLLLAMGTFWMVLYGTFLTRSGVLKDFSVHSFAEADAALYWALLLGLLGAVAAPLTLFAHRRKQVTSATPSDDLTSRDFAFLLGVLVLLVSAAVVAFGTSAPVLSSVLAGVGFDVKPTSMKPTFYNRTHYPVAVLLGILVGMAPLLSWQRTPADLLRKRLVPHLVVVAVGTAVSFQVGVRSGWMLLLIAASIFCFSTAVATLGRTLRQNPWHVGAPVAHMGLALMLIGIVGSSVYSQSEQLTLRPGETKEALGYEVKFASVERPSEMRRDIKLTLARGDHVFHTTPYLVFSPQMDSWVHSPAIKKYPLQDLYLSPLELREGDPSGTQHGDLGKGESLTAAGYTFTFVDFDRTEHHEGGVLVSALLTVRHPDGKISRIQPFVTATSEGQVPHPAKVPGTSIEARFTVSVPNIHLSVTGLPVASGKGAREEIVLEVSNKPLINILWLGTILVLVGGLVAVARRTREARRMEHLDPASVGTNTRNERRRKVRRSTQPPMRERTS